jgi:methane/ammonia monooxygenase subunit C
MHTDTTYPAATETITGEATGRVPGLDFTNLFIVIGGICFVYLASRIYMHTYAFTVGLDYYEPEFARYWMTVFWIQIAAVAATLFAVVVYLWRTRELAPDRVPPEVELNRYFSFAAWLIAYTLVIVIAGVIQGESDAAWHQVVIRDTDFTPTHIALFYLCVPGIIITGVGSFLYAKTRLPMHSRKSLLPLGVAIAGPILIMPNVGFNEWGHTFFYAEELFGAPIHWGFAALGFALLALGGIVIHVLQRVADLIDEVVARAH